MKVHIDILTLFLGPAIVAQKLDALIDRIFDRSQAKFVPVGAQSVVSDWLDNLLERVSREAKYTYDDLGTMTGQQLMDRLSNCNPSDILDPADRSVSASLRICREIVNHREFMQVRTTGAAHVFCISL